MFIVADLVSLNRLKVQQPFQSEISKDVSNESDELLNDTPT